jgi:hypothetical protein
VEAVIFKNTSGRVQFDIVKEKKQAKEFEEFVEKLRSAVRGEGRSPVTVPLVGASEPDEGSKTHNYFCIAAITVGCLWLEISHLEVFAKLGGSDSFVGFLASLLGVGLCVGSFVKAEKWRYFSLLGAALTFVHLFSH